MDRDWKKATTDEKVLSWIEKRLDKNLQYRNFSASEIEHAIHWLNQYKNKDQIHKFSIDKVINSSKKWTEKLIKKGEKAVELETDIEKIADLSQSMILVKLIGESAFRREGSKMQHCVASYYDSDSDIYSVRDRYNNPHCTIEIKDGDIVQIKGKQNRFVITEYVPVVLEALEKLGVGDKLDTDSDKLGLIEINDELIDKLSNAAIELNMIEPGSKLPTVKISNKMFINNNDAFWRDDA